MFFFFVLVILIFCCINNNMILMSRTEMQEPPRPQRSVVAKLAALSTTGTSNQRSAPGPSSNQRPAREASTNQRPAPATATPPLSTAANQRGGPTSLCSITSRIAETSRCWLPPDDYSKIFCLPLKKVLRLGYSSFETDF